MESHLVPGDPILVENIVSYLKAMGVFDEFRHECLADVDTKSSCQNLSQRVDGYTAKFLANETWNPDMNKNEVRNKLRKHIDESGMLAVGADHVVEQVINPKIHQLFLPKIIEVVHQYLNKEAEKLNKKQESVSLEKLSRQASNENTTKAKTTVLDPIADILSFTYSKPKQVTSTTMANSQSKVVDGAKVEKKKEEIVNQTKPSDSTPKPEKKEVVLQHVKTADTLPKMKKEEISGQTTVSDILTNSEKKEVIDPSKENSSVSMPQKFEDNKDFGKLCMEEKVEEFVEASSETVKKIETDDAKPEKKTPENLKLQLPDKQQHLEENVDIKSSSSVMKSSSSKNKVESAKLKKIKSSGSPKPSIKSGECHKSSIKESSDSSSDKLSGETKSSSKSLKLHTKDKPSSLKNNIPTKMVKCEKGGDSGSKSKSKITLSKSSDKSATLKSASKKEDSSIKLKPLADNIEKVKLSKILDSKSGKKSSESSSSSDKGSKVNYPNSSSYDSSQGSDPDKSSSSSVSSKEKLKHFSKHHRKGSSNVDSAKKPSSEKKQSHSDSDSGTPKKDKDKKLSKFTPEELKKSIAVQESAKISSRSDSLGSTSSTSDSQTSVKESSISTSEDTSDNSSKPSDKKKQGSKAKESCSVVHNLPPPSPPPPTPGLSMPGTTSSELSSMGDVQSSPDNEESDDGEMSEEDLSSQSDENSSSDSSHEAVETTEFFQDINDIFLFSSSSSEFEGFSSSPERAPKLKEFTSDVSISPVHTSDLSSFEDEVSDHEGSKDQPGKSESSLRFTIKEAQEILEARAEQQRLEALKAEESLKAVEDIQDSKSSLQNPTPATTLVENEVPAPPEPKRESRRERKLNPKYASSEYTSIFNSKRASFITKQNEGKQATSPDVKKAEANHATNNKRRASVTTPDKSDAPSKAPSNLMGSVRNIISESSTSNESGYVKMEYSSEVISSEALAKTNCIASDQNCNNVSESETRSRIALKIKISASKNDNKTNKDPNTHGTKRKFDGEEKGSTKRTCHRNSLSASSLESVPNENKPLNNKSKQHPAGERPNDLGVERPNDKEIFHKQKVNNGDVLNKTEHVRKNSVPKANHINEEQPGD